MINLAEKHEAKYLKENALRFMIINKSIICDTQDISRLSKEVLVELFRFRSDAASVSPSKTSSIKSERLIE